MNKSNGSLIPANTKKSLLIFGMFRPLPDLLIIGIGVFVTVIALTLIQNAGTLILIACCLPMLISVILVLPIPNYHNTLVAIQSIIRYYQERRNYIWRGWCFYEKFAVDDKHKK